MPAAHTLSAAQSLSHGGILCGLHTCIVRKTVQFWLYSRHDTAHILHPVSLEGTRSMSIAVRLGSGARLGGVGTAEAWSECMMAPKPPTEGGRLSPFDRCACCCTVNYAEDGFAQTWACRWMRRLEKKSHPQTEGSKHGDSARLPARQEGLLHRLRAGPAPPDSLQRRGSPGTPVS